MVTIDVLGASLQAGDTIVEHMPDGADVPHLIDRLAEYPGRFYGAGDHARVAYGTNGWRCTVADGERFHIQTSQEG